MYSLYHGNVLICQSSRIDQRPVMVEWAQAQWGTFNCDRGLRTELPRDYFGRVA